MSETYYPAVRIADLSWVQNKAEERILFQIGVPAQPVPPGAPMASLVTGPASVVTILREPVQSGAVCEVLISVMR